jgi:hypothetical protein
MEAAAQFASVIAIARGTWQIACHPVNDGAPRNAGQGGNPGCIAPF